MSDKHKHSKDWYEDQEIEVGPEIVTYREWYCNCGAFVTRDIVGRRKK